MKRCVALLCEFAGFPAHWAPARWAEVDGTWSRVGPDAHTKASFPARWLRLDLSPTFHPDTLVEVSGGMGTEFPAFAANVVETSRLNRTCITDGVVSTLRNVHTLDLRYTSISDAGALALGKSSTLHTLGLRGTTVTDIGAAGLRNVRSLDLGETSITDATALELSLGSIHTLDLSETGVTDVGAVALSKSRTLHTLGLRGTMVADVGAAALGGARALHTLDLSGTGLTDIGAAALGTATANPAATKLHTLDVSRTGITAVGAAALRTVHALVLPHHLARIASADAHGQEIEIVRARETMLLRAWIDATYTRVPLCERGAGTGLRALYAAYVRASPPVHERTLSQISFKHMLGGIHTPRPVLAGAVARQNRSVYLLRC